MKWRVLGGFAVATAVIALLVLLVGWDDVYGAIEQTDPLIYGGAFAITGLALGFRSLVWIHLLSVLNHSASRVTIAGIFLSAKFFKYVTPYGQLAATPGIALFVSSFTDDEYERNLAAVVGADLFTYTPYYTFGAVGLVYVVLSAAPFPQMEYYLFASAAIVLVLMAAIWLVLFNRGLTERVLIIVLAPIGRLLGRLSPRLGREFTPDGVRRRVAGFYETVDQLVDDRPTLFAGLVFGHLAWLCIMLPLVVTAAAMGVELGVFMAMLIVALSKLGFIVPLPGGLGGVELTIAGLLFLVAGIGIADATALAILYRFATFWLTVFLGGLATSAIILTWPGRESFFTR